MATIAKTKQPVRMPRFGHRVDKTDPILRGCAGWWPLNDGAGTKATDLSTGGNDGTQSGGVSWASTEKGTAASFDGTDDYIDIVGAPADTITQPLTLSAWVYNDAGGSGTNDLVALGDTTSVNPLGIIRFTYSSGQVSAVFRAGSTASIISHTLSNPTGNWNHICVVATSSTSLELFVDGVSVASDTSTNYGTLSYDNLTIGALQRTTLLNYSDGGVQNVRAYDRALSATEVSRLYNEPWAGLEPLSPFSFFSGLSQIYAYYSAAFLQRLG